MFPRLLHTSNVQKRCSAKVHYICRIRSKISELGSTRSNLITNLPQTIITMKLTTKCSSGIFNKVPEFFQRSTDRLHLDSGGSLPTFSRVIWHHTGFRSFFSLFRVPSGVGHYGVACLYVFWGSSTIFVPARSAILNVLI